MIGLGCAGATRMALTTRTLTARMSIRLIVCCVAFEIAHTTIISFYWYQWIFKRWFIELFSKHKRNIIQIADFVKLWRKKKNRNKRRAHICCALSIRTATTYIVFVVLHCFHKCESALNGLHCVPNCLHAGRSIGRFKCALFWLFRFRLLYFHFAVSLRREFQFRNLYCALTFVHKI